jgi:hypothetical protein
MKNRHRPGKVKQFRKIISLATQVIVSLGLLAGVINQFLALHR